MKRSFFWLMLLAVAMSPLVHAEVDAEVDPVPVRSPLPPIIPPTPWPPFPTPTPTPPPEFPRPIADYVSLDEQVELRFEDANTGEHFGMYYSGTEMVNGVRCRRFLRTREEGQWAGQPDVDLLTVDKSGLRLHRRTVRGNVIALDPPVLFSRKYADGGALFETIPMMLNPATGSRTSWQVQTARRLEMVTVPGGIFPDCLKLQLFVKDLKLGTVLAKVDMWFAPGIGPVKRQGQFFGVFLVEELTAIQRKR